MLEESSVENTASFFSLKRFASRAAIPGSSSNKSSKLVSGEKRRPGNSDPGRRSSLGCKGQPDSEAKTNEREIGSGMYVSGVGEAENMRNEVREVCSVSSFFPWEHAQNRCPGPGNGSGTGSPVALTVLKFGGSTENDAPKLSKTWLPLWCRGGGGREISHQAHPLVG